MLFMSTSLTIALAQCNFTVGDFAGNMQKIQDSFNQAVRQKVDLVLFSELCITGYPPEDLLLRPSFQREAMRALEELAKLTIGNHTAMLVGGVFLEGEKCYNAAYVLGNGHVLAKSLKTLLPNYSVFDEQRVFSSSPQSIPVAFKGVKLGVMICEDLWQGEVTRSLVAQGAELLIAINASPYDKEKHKHRLRLACGHAESFALPFIYVNQVGGQDELVFDGAGFVAAADGTVAAQLPFWQEALQLTHWQKTETGWQMQPQPLAPTPSFYESYYQALIMGLRDYVEKNHFPGVLVGLSGGIDSALTAAVAVDALGKERVHTVMMPSRYTSEESIKDATECAALLGCRLDTIPIEPMFEQFVAHLHPLFDNKPEDSTEENLQSRIRGALLMALSNKHGKMVLSTGNKSEMAVGYATLYGDMCGGYNVLKDLYKTEVFALARWRNRNKPLQAKGPEGLVIPDTIIAKPPSAELRHNQTDQDSLPPYDLLDDILFKLIEQQLSAESIIAVGYDKDTVMKVSRLLYGAEYKRRQAPIGVKVTTMSFGRDRRYPVTSGFRR